MGGCQSLVGTEIQLTEQLEDCSIRENDLILEPWNRVLLTVFKQRGLCKVDHIIRIRMSTLVQNFETHTPGYCGKSPQWIETVKPPQTLPSSHRTQPHEAVSPAFHRSSSLVCARCDAAKFSVLFFSPSSSFEHWEVVRVSYPTTGSHYRRGSNRSEMNYELHSGVKSDKATKRFVEWHAPWKRQWLPSEKVNKI